MTLSYQFLTKPVTDLRSDPFQTDLRSEVTSTFLQKFLASTSAVASLTLIIFGIVYMSTTDSNSILEFLFVAVTWAAGIFTLFGLGRKNRLRKTYKLLANHPEHFKLLRSTITRTSNWALPSLGSDNYATRIFWDGEYPGSGTVEASNAAALIVVGKKITLATHISAKHSPPLLVSLHPPS